MPVDLFHALRTFRPAFKQQRDFFMATERFVGANCAPQSGKTFTAARKVFQRICETQERKKAANGGVQVDGFYWIVTSTTDIQKPVKATFGPIVHPALVDTRRQGRNARWRDIKTGGGDVILKNGAVIRFKTFMSGEQLVAEPVDGIWVDEAARCDDETTWGNLFSRLNKTRGWLICTTSAVSTNAFYKYVYRVNKDNPDWKWVEWNSYDASVNMKGERDKGILLTSTIEEARRNLPPHIFKREHLVSWETSTGQVYDCFDSSKHALDSLPRRAPPNYVTENPVYFIGIDPGAAHPTGVCVVSECFGVYHVHEAHRWSTKTISGLVRDVHELAEKYGARKVFYDCASSGAFFQLEWVKSHFTRKNIVSPAFKAKGSVVDGISEVYKLLQSNKLFLHKPKCAVLIDEIASYCWNEEIEQEKPVKQDDDVVDAMRYAICSYTRLHKSVLGERMNRRNEANA